MSAQDHTPRNIPPIAELAIAPMILVIIGGIYMAAHIPGSISLTPAICLLVAAVLLVIVDIVLLVRLRPFAWNAFWRVAGWALLGYAVIAGMIGYAFIYDGTRGAPLGILIGMLSVFAIVVPLLLGFAVARYQPMTQGIAE
jgi:hypothetical protein